MGGAVSKITKVIKKVDPIFGGAASLSSIGLPSLIGGLDKKDMGSTGELTTSTPTGAPTVDEAREAAEQSDTLRKRKGRASTILTSKSGDTSTVNVGTKTLLG